MSFACLLASCIDHPWLSQIQNEWPIDFCSSQAAEIGALRSWTLVQSRALSQISAVSRFEVHLRDECSGVEVVLNVGAHADYGVVKVGGILINRGEEPIRVSDPKVLNLRWAKAVAPDPVIRRMTGGPWGDVAYPPVGYQVHDVQLPPHLQHWAGVEAKCPAEDGRTSNVHQPFLGIANGPEGVLIALEWAGAYSIACKRSQDFWGHQTDADLVISAGILGINATLEPGASIPFPNVYLTFYRGSLDAGCQIWRSYVRDVLAPRLGGQSVRPLVSYNHWIAYEIEQFNEQIAIETARCCADVGIDYLCFDAGWATGGFRAGNGNWELPDSLKIPSGFENMAKAISSTGIKFGCWLEPEFACRGSKLFREHPEWFIQMPNDESPFSMVLMNFGLREVQDWWFAFFEDWYHRCHVRWVRWDFNQQPGPFWAANDKPAGQGLTQINHVIGVYTILSRIIEAFPDLVIEQCASGGTRVEVGMLARGHTCWINDHSSSPHLVRAYQHGMNHLWPAHYANVNAVSRDGKLTESEWLSHQAGSFGISSRLVDWQPEQLAELKRQISRFKSFRSELENEFHSPTGIPKLLSGCHELSFRDQRGCVSLLHDLDSGAGRLEQNLTS